MGLPSNSCLRESRDVSQNFVKENSHGKHYGAGLAKKQYDNQVAHHTAQEESAEGDGRTRDAEESEYFKAGN